MKVKLINKCYGGRRAWVNMNLAGEWIVRSQWAWKHEIQNKETKMVYFHTYCMTAGIQESAIGIASNWLLARWLKHWSSSHSRDKIFTFSMLSRLALGSMQPPIQCLHELFPQEQSSQGEKLITKRQLLPRLRIHGPKTSLWHSA
jgi:hypothetical protein